MIIDHGNLLLATLRQDVQDFDTMGIPALQKLRGKLNSVKSALDELNTYLQAHPFENQAEEITFFKSLKPQFTAIHIYELEIFKIESGKPLRDESRTIAYYEQELTVIRSFFEKHQFLYQYYLLEGNELDISYFTRDGRPGCAFLEEPLDLNKDNATVGDHLFARFIAKEKEQEYLLRVLYSPQSITSPGDKPENEKPMRWSGDKANLIELAYGLWLTGQLNEGNASLNETIKWLENTLSVKLGNFRKRFSELESRKRLSNTKFIDQMKEVILKKMEDDLA